MFYRGVRWNGCRFHDTTLTARSSRLQLCMSCARISSWTWQTGKQTLFVNHQEEIQHFLQASPSFEGAEGPVPTVPTEAGMRSDAYSASTLSSGFCGMLKIQCLVPSQKSTKHKPQSPIFRNSSAVSSRLLSLIFLEIVVECECGGSYYVSGETKQFMPEIWWKVWIFRHFSSVDGNCFQGEAITADTKVKWPFDQTQRCIGQCRAIHAMISISCAQLKWMVLPAKDAGRCWNECENQGETCFDIQISCIEIIIKKHLITFVYIFLV